MRVLVKKWGNSASVRIPAAVMAAARIELDQAVEVREEAGRIIIEPLREDTFKLAVLVDDITSDNLHESIEFGSPAGQEVW
jgi:antitoxin MazE